jgi:DNA-binding NarL/FixJ family response regulator
MSVVKKLTPKQRAKRDERICKMYAKGLSTRKIAAQIGLSKTRVHEIVSH